MVALPTREEINVYNSLDEQWAVKMFLGKDLKEAEAMFREGFLSYQEDLMWMGPRVLFLCSGRDCLPPQSGIGPRLRGGRELSAFGRIPA
jgi:hypothetical protein